MSEFKLDNALGIAIEGGGISGLSYIGFLKAWVESGRRLDQWKYQAGSSVGSIVATLLAVHAPLEYIEKLLRETDFNEFKDNSWNMFKNIYDLTEKYGWYDGNEIENFMADVLENITGDRDITLREIYEIYGSHLIITKTDVLYPRCKLIAMDWKSHPDMKVAHAVRTSSSIPLFFEAVRGEGDEAGHVFVDGGVLLNFPIELLKPFLPDHQIMGLYLTSPREEAEEAGTLVYRPVNGYEEFIKSIAKTWREQAMNRHILSDDWRRTCDIETIIKATQFNLTEDQQNYCIKQGYERGVKFIAEFE